MATRFILESILKLRDDLSRPVTGVFQRVENLGDRAARRIGGKLRSAFSLKRLATLGAVGAGALAGGLTYIAHKADEIAMQMDAINDEAKALGVNPVFLSGLRQAAAESGKINVERVGDAFAKFLGQLEDLRAGRGELDSFLKDIDATAFRDQLLSAKDSTEALKMAFQAIANEAEQSKKIRLAELFFGGRGRDLRRLAATREEWEALLARMPQLAGATQAQFDAATRLADVKDRLNTQIRRVTFQLGGALAPALERVADRAQRWLDANEALVNQRIGEFADWAAERIEALIALDWAGWFEAARELAGDLIDVLAGLGKVVLQVAKFVIALAKQLSSWARRLGIDANALATAGKLLVIAWAATKLLGIASALRTLATRAVELIGGLRAVPGAARRAKLAMAAMFTGGIGLALSLAGAIAEIVGGMRDVRAESERAEVGFDVAGLEAPVVDALNREREKLDSMRDELAAMKRADRTGFKRGHLAPQISALEERIDAAEQRARSLANRKLTLEFIGEVLSGDIKTEKDARLRQGAEMFVRGQTDDRDAKALMREAKRRGLDVEVLADALGGERKKRERVEQNEAALARVDATRTARRDAADAFGGDSAGPLGSAIGQALRRDIEPAAQRLERAGSAIEEMARTMQLMLSEQRTRANLGVR